MEGTEKQSKKEKRKAEKDVESSDDSSSEFDGDEAIDIQFELFDLVEQDFHSLKTFLKEYLGNKKYNDSELADLILKQKDIIGSTIKVEDSDPLGLLTVINITKQKDLECVKQITQWLSKHVDKESEKKLKDILSSNKSIGLILNERMMNIPPQVAPNMHKMLFDEIKEMSSNNDEFKFDYYLMLVGCFQEVSKASKKQKTKVEQNTLYFKPEEEFYSNLAELKGKCGEVTGNRWTLMECEIKSWKSIIGFPASKVKSIVDSLFENLSSDQSNE